MTDKFFMVTPPLSERHLLAPKVEVLESPLSTAAAAASISLTPPQLGGAMFWPVFVCLSVR